MFDPYLSCPCGSGNKFKFCCARKGPDALRKLAELNDVFQTGCKLHNAGDLANAKALYERVIQENPNHADALHQVAVIEFELGRPTFAEPLLRRAVSIRTDQFLYHWNLGRVLTALNRHVEAISSYQNVLKARPDFADVYVNLGVSHFALGELDQSIDFSRKAIRLQPDNAQAHYNLFSPLMLKGEFRDAWPEYEWRWKVKGFPTPVRDFSQPLWDGSSLQGQTLLLHAEQGFGDAIQFIRYAHSIIAENPSVIIECQPPLVRLMKINFPNTPIVERGYTLPTFDVHCPLGSLPLVSKTTLDNIPNQTPYLHADQEESAVWKDELATVKGLSIGLAWAGRETHLNDFNRSIPLKLLAELTALPGVIFFSLQKGKASEQIAGVGAKLIDHTAQLEDFAASAAFMSQLDLVISVDSAPVHLAGALGKKVWTMLPSLPDWRWMLDRDDSPWYPTMKLFRQAAAGDWPGVIERVKNAVLSRERA